MRVWHVLSLVACAVAGLSVAGAAPAGASGLSGGCAALNDPGLDANRLADEIGEYDFLAGEQISVTQPTSYESILEVPSGSLVASQMGPGTVTYLFTQNETTSVRWTVQSGGIPVSWTVSCDFVGLPASSSESAAPIPAWVQAYGRASADASCLEGWNPSWDLWPNGGTGGFVCQRSIPSLG